nr:MAG TPA: hypothetical protein [Caudoviricetes sp.]
MIWRALSSIMYKYRRLYRRTAVFLILMFARK